jgi:UDP-N-acetylmuramate--alanine ligase
MTVDLDGIRRVHFVGIGGIGMSALARHLLSNGYAVSGSDREPGQQGHALAEMGATVHAGHASEHLDDAQLVVVTSAAPADNPEVAAARRRGIPVIKRSELLAAILNPRRGVAVAGTHGKTTTSALIGHLLIEAGLDPTVLIGGISTNVGSNARVGGSDLVVAEADEYDASFLRLRPCIAVVTNVEPDHLDFYGTPERVYEAFSQFAERVEGTLVVCADDEEAMAIANTSTADVVTYGIDAGAWRARDVREEGARTIFSVEHAGVVTEYEMSLAGPHNVRNALAAIAVASCLGVRPETVRAALASFAGVARRSEVIGEAGGVLVMDDYGHHPSEIRTVLGALRRRYQRPIRLIFQPHTYSRTHAFLQDFATSFSDADHVYLLDIYAARETDTLGLAGRDLADAASAHHQRVTYAGTQDRALDLVLRDAGSGDLVLTMGAGDVYRVGPRLLEGLRG